MKVLLRWVYVAMLAACWMAPALISSAHAQAGAPSSAGQASGLQLNLEVLSNTNGATLSPYLKSLSAELRKHWNSPAAAESQAPSRSGETLIRFSIAPDGRVVAMRLEASGRDAAQDRAAWGATRDSSFLPTPASTNGTNLELRVRFVVD